MTNQTITTLARRIARANNACGGNLHGGYLAFDAEGNGGEWHSANSRPNAAIVFRVIPRHVTAAQVQDWLDDRVSMQQAADWYGEGRSSVCFEGGDR
jgi:hypothetical protein